MVVLLEEDPGNGWAGLEEVKERPVLRQLLQEEDEVRDVTIILDKMM